MWMDWDNDYYTFSDTNIEYIWRFLKTVHERGWLYMGHRSTLVPALRHVPVPARAGRGGGLRRARHRRSTCGCRSRRRRRGARRLDDDAVDAAGERRRRRRSRGRVRALDCGRRLVSPTRACRTRRSGEVVARRGARRASGTRARTTTLPRPKRSSTASSRGTRSRWRRAPASSTSRRGAAPRTSSSRASTTCRCSCRSTRPAGFYDAYGWLRRHLDGRGEDPIIGDLGERGAARRGRRDRPPLPGLLALPHAAHLPHRRRVVHRLRRDPPADARRERDREVDARLLLEAHGRLAPQHGRLEHLAQALLRPAASPLSVRRAAAST